MEINKSDPQWQAKVESLANKLNRSYWITEQLLVLAGGDEELVARHSRSEAGYDQVKYSILNERISRIEDDLYEDEKDTANRY